MAQHNSKNYTDFTNVSTGGVRFSSQYSAAETNTDERSLYVRGDGLKYWNGSSESDITSGGSGVSTFDSLYDLDKSLTIDDTTLTFALTNATANGLSVTGSAATAGNLIDITNAGSGKDIDGTSSTWSVTSAGAGDFTSIVGDTVTAGSGSAAGVFASSGNFDVTVKTGNATSSQMNITDGANGDVTFTMNGTGKVEIAGTTETNASLTVTNGDVVISDGSLTITDDDNANSIALTNNTITTGNLVALTSTSLTTGAGVLVTTNGLTEGAIFKAVTTAAGLTTGTAFLFDDGSARFAVKADGATAITTGVNSTKALEITGIQTSENVVTLTSSGVTADDKSIILINSSGNSAAGSNQIRIAPSGTPVETSVGIEFVGASKVMQAMVLDGDSVNNSVVVINGGGALADNKAVLEVTADGTPAATGSNIVRIDGSGLTATNKPTLLEVDGHGKDVIGLFIDADSVGNVALINGGGNIANDTGVLQLTADGGTQSAGGTVLRVVNSGTPNAGSIGVEGVFTSKDMIYLTMAGASATNSAVFFTSTGAIATTKAVLEVTATGTPAAATSNVARFAFTGTATNTPRVVEIVGDGKDVTGLYVDTDATTNSNNYFHADGALAADKAVIEVVSDAAAGNADSAVVRLNQADAAGVSEVLKLVQADVSQPFISFEATIGVGNSIEAVGAKTLTTSHFIMVDVEGVGSLYIPAGTIG